MRDEIVEQQGLAQQHSLKSTAQRNDDMLLSHWSVKIFF